MYFFVSDQISLISSHECKGNKNAHSETIITTFQMWINPDNEWRDDRWSVYVLSLRCFIKLYSIYVIQVYVSLETWVSLSLFFMIGTDSVLKRYFVNSFISVTVHDTFALDCLTFDCFMQNSPLMSPLLHIIIFLFFFIYSLTGISTSSL